jgi:hypothetical protein
MKDAVTAAAEKRDVPEGLIVREAIAEYFAARSGSQVFHHTPTPAETAARKSPARYTKQPPAKKKHAR